MEEHYIYNKKNRTTRKKQEHKKHRKQDKLGTKTRKAGKTLENTIMQKTINKNKQKKTKT